MRLPVSCVRAGLLGLVLAACAPDAKEKPAHASPEGMREMDPFVRERIAAARAACERNEPGALLELAKVYDANGLPELACAAYEQCLARAAEEDDQGDKSSRAKLHFYLGKTLEALQRPEEALRAFDAALALQDDYAPAHWRAGYLLLDFGRVAEARVAFERALALEPNGAAALRGLAIIRLQENDPRGVITSLEPLVARNPDEPFIHGLLARAHRALNDEARAEVELDLEQRADKSSIDDPWLTEVRTRATGVLPGMRRANKAMDSGQPAEAVKVLEELYARVPEDLEVEQMLGKALVAAKDFERAITVLEAGISLHPDEFKLELFLGVALDGTKAYGKAREHLERARQLNPAYGLTHFALGEVQARLGLLAEAEASFTRALEAGASELRTHLLLGRVQLERKAWNRALETLVRASAEYPGEVSVWASLAEAQARSGDAAAARISLAEAERRDPSYGRLADVRALLSGAGAPPR